MKLRLPYLLPPLLLAYASLAFGQGTFWRDHRGDPAPDTEARRSKDGFGGWLVVTPDADWRARWERPSGPIPVFTEAKTVGIGENLAVLIVFANPMLDQNGNASIECDIRVTRPNGTTSVDAKKVVCFRGRIQGPPDRVFLSQPIINYVGEAKDPKGRWVVEVDLQDALRGTRVGLKSSFELR
jgi:hypothetical protein